MRGKLLGITTATILCAIAVSQAPSTTETIVQPKYVEYIREISAKYNVQPELIEAIIEEESNGDEYAYTKGKIGLMQISQSVDKERLKRLGVTNLYDPYSNILVGVDIFMELSRETDDLYLALGYYHGESEIDVMNPSEYIRRVTKRSEELEHLHYGD